MPQYNPNFPQGVPQQPNWGAAIQPPPEAAQQAQAGPDLASQMAAAQAVQAAMAQQQQAANTLPPEVVDAMASRETLKPKAAQIKRQLATADALRKMGSDLNTGSVNGGAPNWAGALANVAGSYMSRKEREKAEERETALGGEEASVAKKYFGAAPKSSFF